MLSVSAFVTAAVRLSHRSAAGETPRCRERTVTVKVKETEQPESLR